MHDYHYRALAPEQRIVSGNLRCQDETELSERLAQRGLELIRAKRSRYRGWHTGGNALARQEMIDFCFQMAQLLAAGIPLLDGLADLRDSPGPIRLAEVIADLYAAIHGGLSFASACERQPQVFTPEMCSLLRAGEQSGELPQVFARLHANLCWEAAIARQTGRLLIYPLFAGIIVLAAILFLLLYLVPPLAVFLLKLSPQLPWLTQGVLALSLWLRSGWLALLGGLIALSLASLAWAARHPQMRFRYDRIKLRLWLLGRIHHQILLARFASLFALLYTAGINILDALQACERACANRVVAEALASAHARILNGETLSQAFARQALFPPLVLRMLRVGEATGRLETSLNQIRDYYEASVQDQVGRLQALIEPLLTLTLGLLLGAVMYAVLAPIYALIGQIRT